MAALNNYRGLSTKQPENTFAPGVELSAYSRGMGGLGLPGDLSSQSRFVRVAFTKQNSKSDDSENASVSQFFHILGSVDQQRGLCEVTDGKYEITLYTSCCNCDKGIYYYTTYDLYYACLLSCSLSSAISFAMISSHICVTFLPSVATVTSATAS